MGATTIPPRVMLPKRWASFGAVKVTTASARNAPGESGWRESASQPEGRSTATTGVSRALMRCREGGGDSAEWRLKAGADDRVEEEVGRFEEVEDWHVVEVDFIHEQKGCRRELGEHGFGIALEAGGIAEKHT
jgi:hypothetical protein